MALLAGFFAYAIFALASGAELITRSGRCPSGASGRLQECVAPIQRMNMRGGGDLRRMCRTMNRGLNCVERLMNRCPDSPEMVAMASMLNMDQVRTLVNARCNGGPMPTSRPTGGNENCPSGYVQRLQSCMRPLQRFGQATHSNIAEACSVAQDGLACMAEIMNNCAGQPEIQAMGGMINMDQLQTLVNGQCAAVTQVSGGSCPSDFVDQLIACITPMSELSDSADMVETCRVSVASFQCYDNIVELCQNHPGFQQIIAQLSMEDARAAVEQGCSAVPPVSGGSAVPPVSGGSCPSDYVNQLIACTRPMSEVADSGDLEEACRVSVEGFQCYDNIKELCENEPGFQQFASQLSMEEVRQSVEQDCSAVSVEEPGPCSDVRNQLKGCNRVLNGGHRTGDVCGPHLAEGFGCLQNLIAMCPEEPEVLQFNSMVDMDEAIGIIQQHCPSVTL